MAPRIGSAWGIAALAGLAALPPPAMAQPAQTQPTMTQPAPSQPGLACDALAAVPTPASLMALPTGGARITAATPMPATGSGPRAVGAFCRVTAEILPVDPAAPPIKVELNLPETWNGRALMYGGGGYNGSILSTGGTIRLQPKDVAIPLGRGYATFGSDSGHAGTSADGAFARNEEALRNYALDAAKKTRDLAGHLIAARYGRPAERVYFHGSSNGGKEALGMIQRYPDDLDGAIVFWPAVSLGMLQLQFGNVARAMGEPGAWPSPAKRAALYGAALEACDGMDGVVDGIIADVRRCNAGFDPATATRAGQPLRCPGGADTGEDCLSDAQIRALRVMAAPLVLDAPLGSGEARVPGFEVWSTDLGSRTSDELSAGVTAQGLGTVAPAVPTQSGMPFIQIFSDQFIRHFVTRDDSARWAAVDPRAPGPWKDRIAALTALMDMNGTDLSAFRRHGGRIILVHGQSDQVVPPGMSEAYYDRVSERMGREAVAEFVRFYRVPGVAHSGNGIAFTPTWDALGALDAWVSNGTPPAAPVVTDVYAAPGRTRPLCEYPTWPRYNGSGDTETASSFTCVR